MAEPVTISHFPYHPVHWLPKDIPLDYDYTEPSPVKSQTTLCVTKPVQLYLTDLFEQHKQKSWADIFPPPGFFEQSDRFFCQTILPGIKASILLESYQTTLENLTVGHSQFSPIEAEKLLECFETLHTLEVELEKILANVLRYKKA